MDYKIIETNQDLPDVLIHRNRDELGSEIVEIKAIGVIDGNEDQFAIETATFPNSDLAFDFIRDFSYQSAVDFCERNNVTYA